MNKTPLLIYTHSDYSFIWPALIDLVNKNVELEIHFAYDKTFKDLEKHNIPINWIKHVYDDSMIWTDRIATILNEIDDEYVLFIHEDWLPTNKVTNVVVNNMAMFMEKNKIWETIGEIIINLVVLAVGTLVTVTAATFMYQMFCALFD